MSGEMRDSQPPPPAGLPTEPVFPACRIIFNGLLEPEETEEINSERLREMNDSAAEQEKGVCAVCIEKPELFLVAPGSCPAKDIPASEVAIRSLRLPRNRAPRRRVQHVLTNLGKTKRIPGLDDETSIALKGLQVAPLNREATEDEVVEDPVAPQALTDLRRGVGHDILKDLGY